MKLLTTSSFDADYAALPTNMQDLVQKKLELFVANPRHLSLRVKKMEGPRNIWEGRITRNYRFTFQIESDVCILRRIGTHNILKTP